MSRERWRVACIQNAASDSLEENFSQNQALIEKALKINPDIVCLPENFFWRGPAKDLLKAAAMTSVVLDIFKKLAVATRTNFLLGSLIEPSAGRQFFNTSYLISRHGKVAAQYRKIHLFKINLKNVRTDESRYFQPGKQEVVARIDGICAGMSICFDLRFPEHFRKLAKSGAKVFFVPANFTYTTGEAHWEALLRARAIENQAFVVAPGQVGANRSTGIRSFGTSLVIDPWGRVVAKGGREKEGVVWADLQFKEQEKLRRSFPVL